MRTLIVMLAEISVISHGLIHRLVPNDGVDMDARFAGLVGALE